ncbi:PDZ domain-containing protein [Rubrobacter marinus]|uniref:PDZ domain-containing protein n=1 Tax=Rubrobacter marinus TaxID=2653852 RepID=A0A6G8PVY8_9ACTN|nr:trypsin-like peptidase domain-containing protein [Rubrobacter marinus]QIN78370.1 PDZ domain-containing protein [Rubrobacter marinus]
MRRSFSREKKAGAAVAVLAALLVAGCGSGGEEEQGGAPEGEGAAAAQGGDASQAVANWPVDEIAAEVEPSVVQVNVEAIQETPLGPQEGEGLGSGVIYREDGYIITNNHVVEGAETVNVAFADGSTEEGEVVGTDPSTDLAVVRVDRENLPAADFVENLDLRPGELAVAVGSPSGFQSTVSQGVISGLNREVPASLTGGRQEEALVDLIQTDAAISPGNSGGALVNEDAQVVGINAAYLPPAQTGAVNIGFAIPSPTAISVADQIIETGQATHPYLGVGVSNLTMEIADRYGLPTETGALVTQVESGSPADDAGIEPRSVITAVGGEAIRDTGDLLAALRDYAPGDRVEMTVVNNGEEAPVTVELGERNR